VKSSLTVLFLVTTLSLGAEVRVANPGIGRETMHYDETLGVQHRSVTVTLGLQGDRLEYRSLGPDLELVLRLHPETLTSLAAESLTKAPDATVRRTTEFRQLSPKLGADDLGVTDLASLPVLLRGFPFGQRSSAKIVIVGNPSLGTAPNFELQVVGREKVTAGGKAWECWKVTTGLGGALSLVLAKSEWWFSVVAAPLKVKSSAPSAGPGSPTRTLVLADYRME